MRQPTKYTKERLEELAKESRSISEVVRKLGQRTDRGFVTYISKRLKEFKIDTSHFMNRVETIRKTYKEKSRIEDFLNNKRSISSHSLRLRLFREGIKEERCEGCGLTHWRGVKLTFELHHLDGNHDNNALENLMIVCPNCHFVEHN